jgi:hypothetical protein
MAREPRKKKEINETQDKIQIQNYYAERSRNLDSNKLEEKIREKDDQRLKLNTVQSRLWQK